MAYQLILKENPAVLLLWWRLASKQREMKILLR